MLEILSLFVAGAALALVGVGYLVKKFPTQTDDFIAYLRKP